MRNLIMIVRRIISDTAGPVVWFFPEPVIDEADYWQVFIEAVSAFSVLENDEILSVLESCAL